MYEKACRYFCFVRNEKFAKFQPNPFSRNVIKFVEKLLHFALRTQLRINISLLLVELSEYKLIK